MRKKPQYGPKSLRKRKRKQLHKHIQKARKKGLWQMKKPPRERWLGSLLQSGDGGEGVEGVFEGLAFLIGEDVAEDEGAFSPLILPSPGGIVGLQD